MGFRFRKRIRIAPGINLNIGKNGITSATIGKRGASLNIGKKGTKATLGLPGTGLSWTSGPIGSSASKTDSKPFTGLVLPSSEYKQAPYNVRRGWIKGGGKVHYGWGYKFTFLFFWILAALIFQNSLPGLSLILVIIGVIRFLWKQPAANYSIKEFLDASN